jgi:hypothetical protein
MANVVKSFDNYKVQYTGSKRELPLASISCFDADEWVGLLEFWERRSSVRDPFLLDGKIVLSFDLDRFSDVVDVLRNERPLKLFLNPDGNWGSVLTSDLEPVGEGE